MIYTRAPV